MDKKAIKLLQIQSWQLQEYERLLAKKDAYLSAAFHEIRNPINSLMNLIEGAKKSQSINQSQEDQSSFLDGLYEASENLLSMINDVLDNMKVDARNTRGENQRFSLLRMMLELESIFIPQFSQKNIKWISDYSFSSQLFIQANKGQLIRILNNLIGNSLKYTSHGTIWVTIKALAFTQGKVTLEFSIKDTGKGIDSWHLEYLCDSFIQIEESGEDIPLTKDVKNSSGLGLTICKGLIQGMGGQLSISSKVGEGSCFSFAITVPGEKSTDSISLSHDSKEPVIPEKVSSLNMSVLYVDDDLTNGRLMVQVLEKAGISCDLATNGSEALKLCDYLPKNYYSMILTDFYLPDMTGSDFSLIIKYHFKILCPIICISGISINELESHHVRIGKEEKFQDFISKPFSIPQLYSIISKYYNDPFVDEFGQIEFAAELNPKMAELSSHEFAAQINPELKEFIEKHRKKFQENYSDSAEKFANLINREDFEGIKKYAHYLKGLLGLLKFDDLLRIVSNIEKQAAEKQGDLLLNEIQLYSEKLKVILQM